LSYEGITKQRLTNTRKKYHSRTQRSVIPASSRDRFQSKNCSQSFGFPELCDTSKGERCLEGRTLVLPSKLPHFPKNNQRDILRSVVRRRGKTFKNSNDKSTWVQNKAPHVKRPQKIRNSRKSRSPKTNKTQYKHLFIKTKEVPHV